jgi:hypothetical protein
VHSWNTFGVRMSHGQTRIHKTHHGLDLGEATTFLLIVYYVLGHRTSTQMSFCPGLPNGVPKFPQLGLPQLWGSITLRADLWLRWGPKHNYSPRRKLSNTMSHATYMWGNHGDSCLLMVRSQVTFRPNLTTSLSFGYNLCLKCPNGSCEPILNIYVQRSFQWYEKVFNSLNFDPYSHSLKIGKSTRTPTPKVEAPLGVWGCIPSHFPTLLGTWSVIPRLPF